MMKCLKGLLTPSTTVSWLLNGGCPLLFCMHSVLTSHREPCFYSNSKANYRSLWWKKISLINIFMDFYKNLVKCRARFGCFINSWVVTDYSNWIHLKLIIFILIIFFSSLTTRQASCNLFLVVINMRSAPWRSQIYVIDDKVDSTLVGIC